MASSIFISARIIEPFTRTGDRYYGSVSCDSTPERPVKMDCATWQKGTEHLPADQAVVLSGTLITKLRSRQPIIHVNSLESVVRPMSMNEISLFGDCTKVDIRSETKRLVIEMDIHDGRFDGKLEVRAHLGRNTIPCGTSPGERLAVQGYLCQTRREGPAGVRHHTWIEAVRCLREPRLEELVA